MTTVISIFCFILMIGLLIFFHEFGHYFIAKRNGVGVVEFSIGMGPKLFSWVRSGTKYCVRALPLGGYCMMLGDENLLPDGETEEEVVSDPEHAFSNKPVWVRIAVIAAGPIFNFILAFLLSLLLVSMVGTTPSSIGGVTPGYPAEEAGLKEGDLITKVDGHPMHLFKQLSLYIALHDGDELRIQYKRDGEKHETTITPVYSEEDSRYYIGILSPYRTKDLNILQVTEYGFHEFQYNCSVVVKSLQMLFTGKASAKDLSGPVGMGAMVNEIVTEVQEDTKGEGFLTTAYWTIVNLLSFSAMISANLGMMNLLPIPAVDGGRLLLLLIEVVIRKPVPKKAEGIVTICGVVFLVLLMCFVMFNDIWKIFHGGFFR